MRKRKGDVSPAAEWGTSDLSGGVGGLFLLHFLLWLFWVDVPMVSFKFFLKSGRCKNKNIVTLWIHFF